VIDSDTKSRINIFGLVVAMSGIASVGILIFIVALLFIWLSGLLV